MNMFFSIFVSSSFSFGSALCRAIPFLLHTLPAFRSRRAFQPMIHPFRKWPGTLYHTAPPLHFDGKAPASLLTPSYSFVAEMSIIFNLYITKSSLMTNSTTNYERFHKYPPGKSLFNCQYQQFQLAAHAKFILWVKNIFSLCCLLRSPPPLRIMIDVLLCSPNV